VSQPLLLDLCSGQGGAGEGYRRAGFRIIGVDVKDHSDRYPGEFHQMEALEALDRWGPEAQAIHTSPPCQRWTHGNVANSVEHHPDLIAAHRQALIQLGVPWVIENVPRAPLVDPLVLCGTMFGLTTTDTDGVELHLRRHRHFEASHPLVAPGRCIHTRGVQWAGAYGGARRDKTEARLVRHGGYVPAQPVLESLLGIGWMTEPGLFQAIPPAYTEWLGRQLLALIT
jgi:DNA (cytosine-5)-methyltransferase 1